MALNLGELTLNLVAQTGEFNKAIQGAQQKLDAVERTLEATGAAVTQELSKPLQAAGVAVQAFSNTMNAAMSDASKAFSGAAENAAAFQGGLQQTGRGLEQGQQKAVAFTSALRDTASALGEAGRQSDGLNTAVKETPETLDAAAKKAAALRAVMDALNKKLAESKAQMDKTLSSFRASMDKAEKQFDSMDKVATGAGTTLSGAFTAPLLAAGGAAVKFSSDFNSAMTESTAIMGDLSDTMRTQMETTAREVAKSSTFGATQAAQAYYFLVSAGMDAAQSMAALPQVAAFAQAGAFDLARATDLLADAQSALGLRSKDTAENLASLARVSDVLVKANILSNASVEQFSESLTNKAGAALRLLGKDVEEGVAVLAAFADQGLKGMAAGESLSIVLRDLQTASIKQREEFDKAGIAVFDAAGNMRNLADIIGELERVLGSMSDEQRRATLTTLGFQDQSVQALQALIGTSDAIRTYETELRKAGGITDEVAKKQLKSFNSQMTLVKNELIDVALTVGEALLPAIQEHIVPALKNFAASLKGVAEWFRSLDKDTQGTILKFAAYTAAIGPALLVTGKLAGAISNLLPLIKAVGTLFLGGLGGLKNFATTASFAFQAWRGGAATFGGAMKLMVGGLGKLGAALTFLVTNPIGLTILAIGALIAAAVLIIKNWEDIKRVTLNVWGSIKATILSAIATVMEWYAKFKSLTDKTMSDAAANTAAKLREMADAERSHIRQRDEINEKSAQSQAITENLRQQAMEEGLMQERLVQKERAAAARESSEKVAEAAEMSSHAVISSSKKQASALEVLDAKIQDTDKAWRLYEITTTDTQDSAEFLAKKQSHLQNMVALVQEKIARLTQEYNKAVASSGEYAEETVKLASDLASAKVELAEFNKGLSETDKQVRLLVAQFKGNLKSLDDRIRASGQEWKLYQANTTAASDSAEYLIAQKQHLQTVMALVSDKVRLLEGQYARTVALTGQYSTESEELAKQLDDTRLQAAELNKEYRDTDLQLRLVTGEVKEAKDALKEAEKATEDMTDKVSKAKYELGNAQDALKATRDAIKDLESDTRDAESGISDAFSAMKGHIKDVETEIDDAKRALKDMSRVKLAGEGEIDEQLEDLETEEAKVRLAINALKREGKKGKDTELEAEEKKLEDIRLKREKIELERLINIEPLHRELERLTQDTKEVEFDNAKAEILALQNRITELSTKKGQLITDYDKLRASVIHLVPSIERSDMTFEEASKAVETYRQRIIDNSTELEKLQENETLQNDKVLSLTATLKDYESQLITLKDKQKEAADSLDRLTEAAKNAAQQMGKPAEPIKVTPQGTSDRPPLAKNPNIQLIGGELVDTRIMGGRLADKLRAATDRLSEMITKPETAPVTSAIDLNNFGAEISRRISEWAGRVVTTVTGMTPALGTAGAGAATVVADDSDLPNIIVKIGNRELEDVVVEARESALRRGRIV